jgi:acetyl-CoA carboxylase carboxyl transferase subunit alpha
MNLIVEREKSFEGLEQRIQELRSRGGADAGAQIQRLESSYEELRREIFGNLTPWERVNMARHPRRPLANDYIALFDQFDELHGDRHFRDDPALVAGFSKLRGRRLMLIAQQKGRDVKENIRRNFGMVSPEGYRKASRLMTLASRLRLPIVTLVDTPGADPGIGSEERAQSEAIAGCLTALSKAGVPVVATIIGEGGSGGALALALADWVIMPQHSIYSVASPEGCASILWGDASRAAEAAERLCLTSNDLERFGIVDEVIAEPLGGAHRDTPAFTATVIEEIDAALRRLEVQSPEQLRERRYEKYRRIGSWQEDARRGIASAAT